jgi:adenosylcobinamide-GDP ribazoletransferase
VRAFRTAFIDWVYACVAAFQFLSRIPLPLRIAYSDTVLRRSVVFYPVVGGVIGALTLAGGAVFSSLLPSLPAAVFTLALWVFLSGALHLDGLMDTADGILSHRSRERMLEIMKDSRVGAMGVIVCVLYLLMKLSLVQPIVPTHSPQLMAAAVCIPVWSRSFMTAAMAWWPYARSSGMGSPYRGVGTKHAGASAMAAFLITLAILCSGGFTIVSACAAAAGLLLLTAAAGWLAAAYMHSKLGGLTGDTYGAINEWLELILLLGVIIYIRMG